MSFQHHPYNPNSTRTKRERFNWSSFMDQNILQEGVVSSSGNSATTTTPLSQTMSDGGSSSNNSHAKSSPRENSSLLFRKQDEFNQSSRQQIFPHHHNLDNIPLMSTNHSLATHQNQQQQHQQDQQQYLTPEHVQSHSNTNNHSNTQTNILNTSTNQHSNFTAATTTTMFTMPISIIPSTTTTTTTNITTQSNSSTYMKKKSNDFQYQHGMENEENNIRLPSIFEWWQEDDGITRSPPPNNNPLPFIGSFPPSNTLFFDIRSSRSSTFSHSPKSSSFVPNENVNTLSKKRHSPTIDSHVTTMNDDFAQFSTPTIQNYHHQHAETTQLSLPLNNTPVSFHNSNNNNIKNIKNINNVNNSCSSGSNSGTLTVPQQHHSQVFKKRKFAKPSPPNIALVLPSSSSTTTTATNSVLVPPPAQQDSFLLQNEYEQFNKGEHEMQKKGRGEKIFKYSYYQYNNASSNK